MELRRGAAGALLTSAAKRRSSVALAVLLLFLLCAVVQVGHLGELPSLSITIGHSTPQSPPQPAGQSRQQAAALLSRLPPPAMAPQSLAAPQRQQQQQEEQQQQQEGGEYQEAEGDQLYSGRTEGAKQPPPQGDDNATVSICISVKDEHCDIREWVLHHASIGVGKVYLFDTGSHPPMEVVLRDMIASGLVQYHHVTSNASDGSAAAAGLDLAPPAAAGEGRQKEGDTFNWQHPIYKACLARYGPRHQWMGFIDADEYVVLQQGVQSLPQLLANFTRYGGLVLHWRLFSYSGHVVRPPGGVLASYTACGPGVGSYLKSFVQPRWTRTLKNVHAFAYLDKRYSVNTAGVRATSHRIAKAQASGAGAQLHHYVTRSLADYELKMRRRSGTGAAKTLANFIGYWEAATATCQAAVPLGRALAARYDLTAGVPDWCLPPAARRKVRAGTSSSSDSSSGAGTDGPRLPDEQADER